jgi:hypothetical protein
MRGGHGDDYYWQLVANIRDYKGVPAPPPSSGAKTVSLSGGFEQWRDVEPEFVAQSGQTVPRDFDGTGGLHYENHSGRNEFAALKVARDKTYIYFYARTAAPVSPVSTNWMWLLIDADQNAGTGWDGYDYIINREGSADGKFWLEKNSGGWNWRRIAPI